MKLKAGIFCGGAARERGRSFEKARSVFQKLDQSLFEPVIFFLDINLQLYQCDSDILYHKNLRDFFGKPSDEFAIYQESLHALNDLERAAIYAKIGRSISPELLPQLINIAFVETWGDQAATAWLLDLLIADRIPYMGASSNLRLARLQKSTFLASMQAAGITSFEFQEITAKEWKENPAGVRREIISNCNFPVRISPNQQYDLFADSIITENTEDSNVEEFIDRAFFSEKIPLASWRARGHYDRKDHIQYLAHPRNGLGFPIRVTSSMGQYLIHHPQDLLHLLNEQTALIQEEDAVFVLESQLPASSILVESIPAGTHFEVLVVEGKGAEVLALYPRIIQTAAGSKFGLTQLQLDQVRVQAVNCFQKMNWGPIALMRGVYTEADQVIWECPDLSSSLEEAEALLEHWSAYHLDSHQLLIYYVAISLQNRLREHPEQKTNEALVDHLQMLRAEQTAVAEQPIIAVLLGGEGPQLGKAKTAARYFWEVTDSMGQFPVQVYQYDARVALDTVQAIEPATLLLHRDQLNWQSAPLFLEVNAALQKMMIPFEISSKVSSENIRFADLKAGFVYPVLVGPIRDGRIQKMLEQQDLVFNGADSQTLSIVNHNPKMLQALARNNCRVPNQFQVKRSEFTSNLAAVIQSLERQLVYPMLVHPGDEDQHYLRRQVNKREELMAYAQLLFRPKDSLASSARQILHIKNSADIPTKSTFWVEELPNADWSCLLSSLFCHWSEDGQATYEILEHSVRKGQQLSTPASTELPAISHPEVQAKLHHELERIARLLNLQSFVTIESYLRIFADNSIHLMLTQVDALPLLVPDHPLLKHALLAGRNPAQVFEAMFSDHLKRNLPLQKTTLEPAMVNNEDENKAEQESIENDPTPEMVKTDPDKSASAFKRTLQEIKAFLVAPIFLRNLAAILVSGLLLFALTLFLLGWYTHHGSSYVVDDYQNMKFEDAKRKARGKNLRAVVIDSIFLIGEAPNVVKDQDPKPGSKVKKRRTIYMWVTGGQAPEILLPNLAGKDDFETYRRELERRNIRLIIKERQFDRKLQENTLLGFYYKGEKISTETVNDGFKVVEGSILEAIVSERTSDELLLPNLVCETFEAAKFQIESNRLILGEVYGTRANNAYVWKQEPAYSEGMQIKTGTVIKLHLTTELPQDCQ